MCMSVERERERCYREGLLMGFKCHLENRRICIFIYSNNDFGISNASQVLNCSRDTKSHVQFWGNNFSSLTNLNNKAVMIKDKDHNKKVSMEHRNWIVMKGILKWTRDMLDSITRFSGNEHFSGQNNTSTYIKLHT